jgi:hypothetical protein
VRKLILLAVPFAVLAAGCSGGSEPEDTAAPPPKNGGVVEKAEGKKLMGAEGMNGQPGAGSADAGPVDAVKAP